MRIAAIDIGTNSIHMVIADVTTLGSFVVVDREREVVQIGRGSFGSGRLRRDAIQRSIDSLARFAQLARRLQSDHIVCTATAAVREAQNGGEFLQRARSATGVSPRVIPAEEECRLIHLAIQASLQLGSEPALIVDIGGGSVQFVVGNRERLQLATSAPLGALRLTEALLHSDPPDHSDVDRLRRYIRKTMKPALERVRELEPGTVYGSSGSIHALAQFVHWDETGEPLEQLNGFLLEREPLERLTRRMTRMSLAERRALHGVDERRAEIILPGALVLVHVLEAMDADGVTVSDFGVREGLVTDYIRSHPAEVSRLADVDDLRLRSVYALLDRFQADGNHPRHVARLALTLYDGFRAAHRLPITTRELLHFAALLHDIGSAVGFDDHADHSAYVIRNGNLRGLSAAEVEIVANVARYHSKAAPRKSDPAFAALPKADRRAVRWLAAVLRVAECLDRSHYQLIRSVRVSRRGDRYMLHAAAKRDAKLELWATRRRLDLLARMLGSKRRPATVSLLLEPFHEGRRTNGEARRAERPSSRRGRAGNGRDGAPARVAPAVRSDARSAPARSGRQKPRAAASRPPTSR